MPTKVFLCFIYLESNTLVFPSCKNCVFPLKCRAGDHARTMLDFPFLNVWYHQALLTGNCVAVSLCVWLQDNIPHGHFLTLVIHKVACATLGNDVRRTSKTPDGWIMVEVRSQNKWTDGHGARQEMNINERKPATRSKCTCPALCLRCCGIVALASPTSSWGTSCILRLQGALPNHKTRECEVTVRSLSLGWELAPTSLILSLRAKYASTPGEHPLATSCHLPLPKPLSSTIGQFAWLKNLALQSSCGTV